MDLIGAILVVLGFAYLVHLFGLVRATQLALSISREAVQVISHDEFSDEEKEQRLKSSSVRLFRILAILIFGTFGALLLPFGVVWIAQFLGIMTHHGVIQILLRWDFVVGASIVGVALYFCLSKWSQRNS
jgi:hypothetical protein